jgi:hypothetical protein
MAMSVDELRDFVKSLEKLQVFQGLKIHAEYDKQYHAGVWMTIVDRLTTAPMAPVIFQLTDPRVTTDWIITRLADEVAAAVKELFLKAAKGHQYNGDGAPVKLVEALSIDKVVRL